MKEITTNNQMASAGRHLPGFLSVRQVQVFVGGKSRSCIYDWVSKGIFPRPVKISGHSVAWSEESLISWRDALLAAEVA